MEDSKLGAVHSSGAGIRPSSKDAKEEPADWGGDEGDSSMHGFDETMPYPSVLKAAHDATAASKRAHKSLRRRRNK